MPLLADTAPGSQVAAVKASLAAALTPVSGVNGVYTFEPRQAPAAPPILTMMTAGFRRSGLENPEVGGGSRLIDPLGHRAWVWQVSLRLWVPIKTSERTGQEQTDSLLPLIVAALEADRSLGGTVEDTAVAQGNVGVVDDQRGSPLMVTMMDVEVAWVEAT